MVEVTESYRRDGAQAWMRPTVERLLRHVGADALNGLGTVVITDSASVGRGKTRRVLRPIARPVLALMARGAG